jgi:septal ring factor EnvC (AmiA/AmiB activator)
MASKSHVHAARSSPIPGLVVVVLAVAALLFGLAIVQAPPPQDDLLKGELVRLRVALAAADDDRAALTQTITALERSSAATRVALEALQQRTHALEEALQRDGLRSR